MNLFLFLLTITVNLNRWCPYCEQWSGKECVCICTCAAYTEWVCVHVEACSGGGDGGSPMLGQRLGAFSASQAINQCLGQPGQEHFQTHLQKIMPAIPPSPRDKRARLMNHCPFRGAATWISPPCIHRVPLALQGRIKGWQGKLLSEL